MKPTQEQVKELFNYNPETGIVTRKKSVANNTKTGDTAGWINGEGYLHVKINGFTYKLHRIIWLYVHGDWPEGVIDHINNVKTDNRLCNLRSATIQVNNINRLPRKDCGTGVPGVTFHARDNAYYAACKRDGKQNFLGYYKTIEEASKAVEQFKKNYEIGRNYE